MNYCLKMAFHQAYISKKYLEVVKHYNGRTSVRPAIQTVSGACMLLVCLLMQCLCSVCLSFAFYLKVSMLINLLQVLQHSVELQVLKEWAVLIMKKQGQQRASAPASGAFRGSVW